MFIPTSVVCYLNANFCSARNGNKLPIPSSPQSFCAMVAVPAGADTPAEAAPGSASMSFPGFPGLVSPPLAVQLLVACMEPWPGLCAPSKAFFWAGCAAGLQPSAAPCRRAHSHATKHLCAWMTLELISVTGWLAAAERRRFWLTASFIVPCGRRSVGKSPRLAAQREEVGAFGPPEHRLPGRAAAAHAGGSCTACRLRSLFPRASWGTGPSVEGLPRLSTGASSQLLAGGQARPRSAAAMGSVRWEMNIFSMCRAASNTRFHPLSSSRAVLLRKTEIRCDVPLSVTQQLPRVSAFHH